MKTAPTPAERSLRERGRHRLVGAVTLVALGVLSLPWLLGPARLPRAHFPALEPVGALSASPSPDLLLQAAPKPLPPAAAPPPGIKSALSPITPATNPESNASAPVPAYEPLHGRLWLQVGVFSEPAKAHALVQKLKSHGIVVLTEHVTMQGANRLRLRVGPLATRLEAQHLKQRLERLQVKAVLVP